ncbi:MAG: elongation factor P hydroxylase [Saccharospirillaceae bacterium]|nr:elongation factor P hydroxylase [Pseudomonadales bacterium]NRB80850.1 elongation factor P hydroxylase [Saccharospirillaceae bacterium]
MKTNITTDESTFINQHLIDIFNDCFQQSLNTILVDEGNEPIYIPLNDTQKEHRIYFAHGYFSSALHEIAHWLVAGEKRRQQQDYGYWYAPDGRDQIQQNEFEQVEVKPQAIEWILHQCCQKKFRLSLDNLSLPEQDNRPFARAVYTQTQHNFEKGLNNRVQVFCAALMRHYQNPQALEPNLYQLGDLSSALA